MYALFRGQFFKVGLGRNFGALADTRYADVDTGREFFPSLKNCPLKSAYILSTREN
jgi:hypothetical protein